MSSDMIIKQVEYITEILKKEYKLTGEFYVCQKKDSQFSIDINYRMTDGYICSWLLGFKWYNFDTTFHKLNLSSQMAVFYTLKSLIMNNSYVN